MHRAKSWLLCLAVIVGLLAPALAGTNDGTAPNTTAPAATSAASANASGNVTALLGVLVMKGVLSPSEASSIQSAAPAVQVQALLEVLARKGVVNASEVSAINAPPTTTAVAAVATPTDPQQAAGVGAAQALKPPPPPAGPSVVAAIAPLRVLPVDPPKKDGLAAAFKMGGVKMTPYGFIKSTAVHDSSSPNGDDFPFVGLFLGSTSLTNTGPTASPEFHLKARSARIGANFEFPDVSPKLVLTGRMEGDFEGNFSEVDNRDVSSIRSSSYQLRLAYARLDYNVSDATDVYFEGGQDWTLFGSSALPNLLETTFLGAYYGDVWERSPQFQFGLVQKLSTWRNLKVSPTFALMMPSSGQIEKLGSLGLEGQIAQAEREGADSGRPEVEARVAFQFQLDPAKGVAPAQLLWSGFEGKRTSIVTSDAIAAACAAGGTGSPACTYAASYGSGFTASSTMYGNQLAVQLPTRWVTVVASSYYGGDLRFFFGGQVNSYFTDMTGLSNPVMYTTVDGGPLAAAGGAVLATNAAGDIVVAPQRPIRSFGGFINVGFPLSRWFNANPKGHNAGWQLYLHAGKDQVVHRDLINPGATGSANVLSPLPLLMGKVGAVTLYYKLNPYCSFGFEQSVYGTRLTPGAFYTIAGGKDNLWQDHRTEFGPIFTF